LKRKIEGEEPHVKKVRKKISAPLPEGAELFNRFRAVFIPTYERWVGMQPNPWLIPDDDAVKALRAIWNTIYDNEVPWLVTVGDCVFDRVRDFIPSPDYTEPDLHY
jgi:hypothetical protein